MNSQEQGGLWAGRLLLATIAVTPLVILPGVSFFFDITPKIAIVLAGTAAALLLQSGEHSPRGRKLRQFGWLLAAQAGALVLATIRSSDPALSITGTNWRRFGTVVQLALLVFTWLLARSLGRSVNPAGGVQQVLRVVALAGLLPASYGIAQYFGWDFLLPRAAYRAGEDFNAIVRPPATMGHANYFATYLLAVVFAGVALADIELRRRWRVLGFMSLVVGVTAMALTGTRSALLGLLCGVLFWWILRQPRLSRKSGLWAAAALVSMASFYFSPAGSLLRSRVKWSGEDLFGGARLWLYRDTLRMAGDHWLTGTGPETFAAQFARAQSLELAQAYPDFRHESPHNVFLDALATEGALGLAALLALTAFVLTTALAARAASRRLSAALAASFVASLVSLQFQAFVVPTALCWYSVASLLLALAPDQGGSSSLPVPGWRAVRRAVAVGLALVFAVFVAQLTLADVALARVRSWLDLGRIDQAMEEHRTVLKFQPAGMSAELWYSRALMQALQRTRPASPASRPYQEAFNAALRATRTSEERQNAYYNLAAMYAAWNDPARTIQTLRASIACAPGWYKPHWTLAQVLRAARLLDEAEAEADLAIRLGGGRHPEVIQTRAEIQELIQMARR